MEAKTAPSPTPSAAEEPQVREDPDQDLIKKAAEGKQKLDPIENADALAWFLSDDPEETGTKWLEINVGTSGTERWIKWEIQSVDVEQLRRIRRQVAGPRAQRRNADGGDEFKANLKVVVEGTVTPDLAAIAVKKGIANPEAAVEVRFDKKPGLLGQIAAEIMAFSGYDEEDVREVAAASS